MTISTADAPALKNALRSGVKTWHVLTFPNSDDAVQFVNVDPPQGAGEVCFSNRPDGQVDLMFFL
ncbi:hypothetical protein [Streptomyces sp. 7N604]|uniref:hypothetical protein n=1 Tax=Streptomyces sp. 7N604 TaxID=3457415 RepID=UPI003FD42EE4